MMSEFATTILNNKYAHTLASGRKETWEEIAERQVFHVIKPLFPDKVDRIKKFIQQKKFVPGGRYLYAVGKKYPQVNNCFAGSETVLTDRGTFSFEDLVGSKIKVRNWLGEWEEAEVKSFGEQQLVKMTLSNGDEILTTAGHRWIQPDGNRLTTMEVKRVMLSCTEEMLMKGRNFYKREMYLDVVNVEVTNTFEEVYCVVAPKTNTFTLGNGVLTSNCFLFRAEDTREGWGELTNKAINALMTGGGVGVVYSNLRGKGSMIGGLGGQSTGPLALMQIVNESGRFIMQGGSRRSAIWAGLHWNHADIFDFINLKNWKPIINQCKQEDFNFPATMDGTNISVILDDKFFESYEDPENKDYHLAHKVYDLSIRGMLKTGEPGFSIDINDNHGENLRNACTEVCSKDDSDMCNLGSINLGAIESLDEFGEIVELGTLFLLCGTIYSKLPMQHMYKVREKNRRLGLGLMGVHEWLIKRGYRYERNEELEQWMQVYTNSQLHANRYSDKLSISRPVATRSIAPTGTISIISETTSGLEPIFNVAYKRRYLKGEKNWCYQYVVDPTAHKLIQSGIDPRSIEDAEKLSTDVNRRIQFQSFLQQYVDHGISSTINLPSWGSEHNNESKVEQFAKQLYEQLPKLRGITTYPNNARGGQPLNSVDYFEAINKVGYEIEESGECKGGVCGS